MQSAAVQRPCCGLGKNSEFTYLPTEHPTGLCQPPNTAEPRQELALPAKVTSKQKSFQRPSSLAPGLWKQLGFRRDCLLNVWGWKEQSVSARKTKKSKHFTFCFLPGFQDTVLEDIIKAGCRANRDRKVDTNQSISLQAHQPPPANSQLRKRGAQRHPVPRHSAWFPPGRAQSWNRALSQARHARRRAISICEGSTHPCFTSLPASQESGKRAPTVRQLMLRQNERHQIDYHHKQLQLYLPAGALLHKQRGDGKPQHPRTKIHAQNTRSVHSQERWRFPTLRLHM